MPPTWENVHRIDGVDFDSAQEGRSFLREPPRGDKWKVMAIHLIATILNFQFQDPPHDPCVDTGIVDGDSALEAIRDIKRLAENWLETSDWPDMQVRKWTVRDADISDGEVLKDAIDDFNNNQLDLDGCGC